MVYKTFLLLGGIEIMLNITFCAEKSYRLEIWFQIKNYPIGNGPHNVPVHASML